MSDAGERAKDGDCTAAMLRTYDTYDEAVDIVSTFQAFFTRLTELQPEVAHFERFPKIPRIDGNTATPDFSVLFANGTGIVGEIAQLALHDNSVDKVCKQIGHYDGLTQLPSTRNRLVPVTAVDVLLLVRHELSNDAVDRIIRDRALNDDHSYSPVRPPVIVGYSRNSEHYVYVRNRDAVNGTALHRIVQDALNKQYKARHGFWSEIKVQYPICNDRVDPLYAATLIWTKVLPVIAPGLTDSRITLDEIVEVLARQYTRIAKRDVERGLEVLVDAGWAKADKTMPGVFALHRGRIPRDNPDVAARLAEASCRKRLARHQAGSRGRGTRGLGDAQLVLFSDDTDLAGPEEQVRSDGCAAASP